MKKKEKINFTKLTQKKRGISLVTLIITVIVIIILSAVVLMNINSGNIIGNASKTRYLQDRDTMQELLDNKLTSVMISQKKSVKTVSGKIVDNTVEITRKGENGVIAKIIFDEGNDSGDVYYIGEKLPSYGNDTRWYVDEDGILRLRIGNIMYYAGGKTEKVVEDGYPGDITDGGKYTGSEENPYVILSIEDLVAFSNSVNSGNTYSGKYIVLGKSLDFKDEDSYINAKTVEFGDINEDGKIEGLIEEMQKGIGFTPIGRDDSVHNKVFYGNFNGNRNSIINLYENNEVYDSGLFGYISNVKIKDLNVVGTIYSVRRAGGICGAVIGNSIIENCKFSGIVKSDDIAGGIAGFAAASGDSENLVINRCVNVGEIFGTSCSGGIVGSLRNLTITNSYNEGRIYGGTYAGGIIGESNYIPIIYNSYNIGMVESDKVAGGIAGDVYQSIKISNVYSSGMINAPTCAGIIGTALWNNPDITVENSYYLKDKTSVGSNKVTDTSTGLDESYMKSNEFMNLLNSNIGENVGWLRWKFENSSYPTF